MLTKLTHVTLFVNNQDEALDFYTKKLGFVLNTDALFGENMRWLTVNPKDQKDVEIALFLAETNDELALVGKQGGSKPFLAFSCENCAETYEVLKNNGVKIISTPEKQAWGTSMAFEDLYGNNIYVVEQA